jgi:hypothetical protein
MDGAAMANPDVNNARPRKRALPSTVAIPNRFDAALLFSCCVLSLFFVVVSGLVIALMQFQTRMLQANENFSSGDIVLYADLDKAMRKERDRLDELFQKSGRLSTLVNALESDVAYRIGHICQSLQLDADDYIHCETFLKTIPFNLGTVDITIAADKPPVDVASAGPIAVSDRPEQPVDDLTSRLVTSLQTRLGLTGVEAELLVLHAASFKDIAVKNIELRLDTQQRFFRVSGELSSRCGRIIRFAAAMDAYRSFNVGDCYLQVAAGPPAAPAPPGAAAPVAKAGPALVRDVPKAAALTNVDTAVEPPSGEDDTGTAAEAEETATGDEQPGSPAAETPGQPYVGGSVVVPGAVTMDAKQRNFELVAQYLFYDWLSFGLLNRLLITPNDFIAFTLVALCGVLGGLLKLIVNQTRSGRFASLSQIVSTLLLGLICALIVYSLFRTGFIVLTTQSSASADSGISPFIIALLALGSGFVSDRAIALFRNWIDERIGQGDEDDSDRWAFGLGSALESAQMSITDLAERLFIDPQQVQRWVEEQSTVEFDFQEKIALLLGRPRRELFSVDPPLVS